MSLVEELGGGVESVQGFKIKKWGVIPAKRRSVKMMMFHKLVKSVSSSCCHVGTSRTASALQPKKGGVISTVKPKNMKIFPGKDHLLTIVSQNDPSAN